MYRTKSSNRSARAKRALLLCVFAALFWPSGDALRAETIVLKNGQILSGKVVSQNKTSITVQTENGRRTILKSQIRRIDYKSPEAVRREEDQRRQREAAERRRKQQAEAARKAEEERQARLKAEEAAREAERLRKQEEAAREAERKRIEQEKSEQTTVDSESDARGDPGLSLGELLGDYAFGAGFEFHDAASADFFYDGPTNLAGGNHLFERTMGSQGALAPVLFYEQSVGEPWLMGGIEAGFLYRRDELRPGLLYPALSGWEFFVRPSLGARFQLGESFALHLRGLYAFAATQMGREFYGPEWTLNQGLVLDQLDGIQRYRIRNPQYGGPAVRIALEFDRFRVWLGRQWLSGKAGDARIFRDNWIVGVGMKL